jgi:hypothetical protein
MPISVIRVKIPENLFRFSDRILTKVSDYNRLVFHVIYGSKKRFI